MALSKDELTVLAAEHQACITAAPKTTAEEVDALDILFSIRKKLGKMIEAAGKPASTPASNAAQTTGKGGKGGKGNVAQQPE